MQTKMVSILEVQAKQLKSFVVYETEKWITCFGAVFCYVKKSLLEANRSLICNPAATRIAYGNYNKIFTILLGRN